LLAAAQGDGTGPKRQAIAPHKVQLVAARPTGAERFHVEGIQRQRTGARRRIFGCVGLRNVDLDAVISEVIDLDITRPLPRQVDEVIDGERTTLKAEPDADRTDDTDYEQKQAADDAAFAAPSPSRTGRGRRR